MQTTPFTHQPQPPQGAARVWPFPPSTGPAPWTPAQIAAHATQQRASAGEALL